jgi:hypothetical protein
VSRRVYHGIADFVLVSRYQVICLGERTSSAGCHRAIILYELPPAQQQGPLSADHRFYIDQQTRFAPRATFHFPPTNPSSDASFRMQGILDGESEDGRVLSVNFGTGTMWQGAVLLSHLKAVAATVRSASAPRSAATVHDRASMPPRRKQELVTNDKPIHIRWPDWESIFHTPSGEHAAFLAHGYRLAGLVPDSVNIGHVCLLIREYDPRMLLAPASHLLRNLGDFSHLDKRCSGGWKVTWPCRTRTIPLDPKLFTEDLTSIRLFWAGDTAFVFQSRASVSGCTLVSRPHTESEQEPDRLFVFRSNQ